MGCNCPNNHGEEPPITVYLFGLFAVVFFVSAIAFSLWLLPLSAICAIGSVRVGRSFHFHQKR